MQQSERRSVKQSERRSVNQSKRRRVNQSERRRVNQSERRSVNQSERRRVNQSERRRVNGEGRGRCTRSVMMRLTQRCPVTGSVHCFRILGLPFYGDDMKHPQAHDERSDPLHPSLPRPAISEMIWGLTNLGDVLHRDDDTLAAGDQVHGTAHALHHLALAVRERCTHISARSGDRARRRVAHAQHAPG